MRAIARFATASALLALASACASGNGKPAAGSGGSGSGGTATPPASGGGAAGGRSGSSGGGGAFASGGTTVPSVGGTGGEAAGGATGTGTMPGTGGTGATSAGGTTGAAGGRGGTPGTGGSTAKAGADGAAGDAPTGGVVATGGISRTGGAGGTGGAGPTGGGTGTCAGPVGTFTGELATGIAFMDDRGQRVNAHGGGIIKEGDTYYMHGEYFLSTTTDNNFNGFSMYSSKDLASWKWERMILPQQPSGLLGPNRKGERPHIIKCPSTGEFVLYAHAASTDYQTDKEVVYATSAAVNGDYTLVGALTNAGGTLAAHSDMSAFTDGNTAYVVTESGHVYTLASDCHSWLSDKTYSAVNGDSGGSESPTVFKAASTYYWIGSYKTGWRANNNFYSTAPAVSGPWTFQGFLAPVADTSTTTPSGQPNPPEWISDERTWLSQSTWVTAVTGCSGTVYVFWGDHWYGDTDTSNPGKHNDQATYVFQPLVLDGTKISMPTYLASWKLDVGAGTWSK